MATIANEELIPNTLGPITYFTLFFDTGNLYQITETLWTYSLYTEAPFVSGYSSINSSTIATYSYEPRWDHETG